MEKEITIKIEPVTEGLFLATSDDLPGLFVEAQSEEALRELARDLALELIEMDGGSTGDTPTKFRFVAETEQVQ